MEAELNSLVNKVKFPVSSDETEDRRFHQVPQLRINRITMFLPLIAVFLPLQTLPVEIGSLQVLMYYLYLRIVWLAIIGIDYLSAENLRVMAPLRKALLHALA